MPKFTLVCYETIKLTRTVEAGSIPEAIAKGNESGDWENWDEETLGTNGVEQVLDETGRVVWANVEQ